MPYLPIWLLWVAVRGQWGDPSLPGSELGPPERGEDGAKRGRLAGWLTTSSPWQAGGGVEGPGEGGDPCVRSLGRRRSRGALRLRLRTLCLPRWKGDGSHQNDGASSSSPAWCLCCWGAQRRTPVGGSFWTSIAFCPTSLTRSSP